MTVKLTVWTALDESLVLSQLVQNGTKKSELSFRLTIEWE